MNIPNNFTFFLLDAVRRKRKDGGQGCNCTLNVSDQKIWLQNRLTGQAPLTVETNGIVTTVCGQNDLSDEKVKQNIRDADLVEIQSDFMLSPRLGSI